MVNYWPVLVLTRSYSPIMLNPYLSAIELPQGASLSRAADKAALTPMVAERESAKRASRVGRAQDFADHLDEIALHRPILKHKVWTRSFPYPFIYSLLPYSIRYSFSISLTYRSWSLLIPFSVKFGKLGFHSLTGKHIHLTNRHKQLQLHGGVSKL